MDSYPLHHQGSPSHWYLIFFWILYISWLCGPFIIFGKLLTIISTNSVCVCTSISESNYADVSFGSSRLLKMFICLHQSYLWHSGSLIFTVAREIFSCSIQTLSCSNWDLVPRPGTGSRPPTLGVQGLSHWATWDVPLLGFFVWFHFFLFPFG